MYHRECEYIRAFRASHQIVTHILRALLFSLTFVDKRATKEIEGLETQIIYRLVVHRKRNARHLSLVIFVTRYDSLFLTTWYLLE